MNRTLRSLIALLVSCTCLPVGAAERVAVLINGNVLVGEIEQHAEHVIISARGSEIRLPAREVEMVEASISAVYRRKSAAIPRSSSRARSNLIRWCLRHDLRTEARQELELLRRVDPNSPELGPLEDQVNAFRQPARTVIPSQAPIHSDSRFAEKYLGQLSKSAVAEFVNGIQPLLLNRCGQAGCHGKATSSSYSLVASRWSRVPRNITHRNLGATLQRIGHYPAEQTLLWMSARSAHGALTAGPLPVTEQQKLLAWIQHVKTDLGSTERQPSGGPSSVVPTIEDDVDPFDPAVFNSQYRKPQLGDPKLNAPADQVP